MAKGRKAQKQSNTGKYVVVAAVALIVVAAVFVLSQRGGDGTITSDREYISVSDFSDVHGLAVNPENANEVYVATHHGLIRGLDGAWARVGSMQDDLMGFSMHPTNGSTFWTSGHPRGGGNMGVRQSTDGGFTWTTTWTDKVDFHAMTVSPADPDTLWGSWGGKLYQSTDAGRAWINVNPNPPATRALVADPKDPNALYATTQSGISTSTDSGRTWRPLASIAALGLAIDPTDPQRMYAGGQALLWTSSDAGVTWTPASTTAPGTYAYLSVSALESNVVYAATYETGVYKSVDSGETWLQIKAPRR